MHTNKYADKCVMCIMSRNVHGQMVSGEFQLQTTFCHAAYALDKCNREQAPAAEQNWLHMSSVCHDTTCMLQPTCSFDEPLQMIADSHSRWGWLTRILSGAG